MKKPSKKTKEPSYRLTEEDVRLTKLFVDYANKWTAKRQDRYNSVRDSVEAYAKSKNIILPPKFIDFVEYMLDTGKTNYSHLSEKDLLGYHDWKISKLNSPTPKKQIVYTPRAAGFALATAFNNDEIDESIFNTLLLYTLSKRIFNRNGKRPSDFAKQNFKILNKAKIDHQNDSILGERLYELNKDKFKPCCEELLKEMT